MKGLVKLLSLVLVTSLFLTGCSSGPSKSEVEAALRDAIISSDALGLVGSVVKIDNLTVDNITNKEAGIFEATVTISSSSKIMGFETSENKLEKLLLKKINGQWKILQ